MASFFKRSNFTKLERLHQVVSRAISGCLSSTPILVLLPGAPQPPLQVNLTHFPLSSYERALRLPTSFPISGFTKLGSKSRHCKSSWRTLASTHPLMLSSTFPREALFASLPYLLGTCIPSFFAWSPPFLLHAPALIPIPLAKGRLSLT